MVWPAFLTSIANHLGLMGTSYLKRKQVEAEGRIDLAMAMTKAQAQVQVAKLTAEIEWERSMADSSKTSWKDEYWTIILSIPIVLAFFPTTIQYLEDGFNVLSKMPQWYGVAVGAAISAAFGKNVISHFTNMKK